MENEITYTNFISADFKYKVSNKADNDVDLTAGTVQNKNTENNSKTTDIDTNKAVEDTILHESEGTILTLILL